LAVQSAGAAEAASTDGLSAAGQDEALQLPQLPPKVPCSSADVHITQGLYK
jgi:hypothetical protein